jgi:hypothetical protein
MTTIEHLREQGAELPYWHGVETRLARRCQRTPKPTHLDVLSTLTGPSRRTPGFGDGTCAIRRRWRRQRHATGTRST